MSRVLIADDDRTSLALLKGLLVRWGYQVISADDGHQAWRLLQQPDAPQLAILDWGMPGLDGPEICRRVRSQQGQEYTFIVLLTGRDGVENIVAGMDAGADDYVVKPFIPDELRARLRAGERILRLESELLRTRNELLQQSRSDPLTGILNRRAILEGLEQELARATREGAPFCLGMLDLDHFKQINDHYGHQAGDAVLCAAVERATLALRNYDRLGRFGGEEFLLLLPHCDLAAGEVVAERVRQRIAAAPVIWQQQQISVTVSLGVAARQPDEPLNLLLGRADTALYRAKELGRNRVFPASGPEASMRSPLPATS